MGTERSGRRKIESPQGLSFHAIGTTENSVRSYLADVARYLGEGRLDPRVADSMTAAGKAALQAIKERNRRTEVTQLEEILRRSEAVANAPGPKNDADQPDPGKPPGR